MNHSNVSNVSWKGVKLGVHLATETAWWIYPNGTYSFCGPADVDRCLASGATVLNNHPSENKTTPVFEIKNDFKN